MKERIALIIDNQEIRWSFWQMVINKTRGDRFEAARIFYRAHYHNAKSIVGWVKGGLSKGYAMKPCRDEYEDGGRVKAWIDAVLFNIPIDKKEEKERKKPAPEKDMASIGDVLASMGIKMEATA